jgi:hypothetical protein
MHERVGVAIGFLFLSGWIVGCARSVSMGDGDAANAAGSGGGDHQAGTAGSAGAHGIAGATGGNGTAGSAGLLGTAGVSGNAGTAGAASGAGMTGGAGVSGSAGMTGGAGEPEGFWPCGVELTGGGRSFGECEGACHVELSIFGSIDLHLGLCAGVSVSLVARNTDGSRWTYFAQMSQLAVERAADISLRLRGQDYPEVTGCPDCVDQGAAWVSVRGRQASYPFGQPPEALRAADLFVHRLIEEVRACEGPMIEDCSRTWNPTPDSGDRPCQFTYTASDGAVARCELPVDVPSPCRQAVTCLCLNEVLGRGTVADLEACVRGWTVGRGAITFADFCVGPGGMTNRTLGNALFEFGRAYGASVESHGCAALPASL